MHYQAISLASSVSSRHTISNTFRWNDRVENYSSSIKKMKKLYLDLFLSVFLLISTKFKLDETKKKNRKLSIDIIICESCCTVQKI